MYHYIENTTINSKISYRIVKELKSVLLERRELKREQSLLSTYNNEKGKLNLKANRSLLLLASINKESKNLDKEYNFRVYNQEDFISKMEN